jgi:glycosyltransferase involved in cell wall biosynthesis
MSQHPLVDVVTDAHRRQMDWERLARTLREQSLQSWRWLIRASSEQDVPQALRADPRVELVDDELLIARIAASDCPYVLDLDPACTIAPTFLEKCLWLLASNPRAAFCNSQSIADDGEVWEHGFEQGARFLHENFAGATCVFRREAYALATPADGAQDFAAWERWLRLAAGGMWGQTIPEALIRYPAIDRSAPFRPADAARTEAFRAGVHARYPQLADDFPAADREPPLPYAGLPEAQPLHNRLARTTGARRLLILMPWLIVGGAERVNLELVQALTASGQWEISIATYMRAHHSWAAEFARSTPDIFQVEHFLAPADHARFLVYLIESRQIDAVLISNSYAGYQLLPYMRACCPHVTFVDLLHSQQESWKNGGYPRCGAAYQDLLDLNIAASEYVKRWMVGRGARPERIEVCYTNIDTQKWRPDPAGRARRRATLQLGEEQTLIVFHGRLSPEKRPTLLARIVARLRQEVGDRFRCVVIGDGPERAALDQLVRELGLSAHVSLVGRLDDADLHSYLAAADILLLPSQVEGISVSTFEAMAMGVMPVSADVGGQAELIAPECGFLVPHGPTELEDYVSILRTLVLDRELTKRMGAAARERVERQFPLSAFGPRMAVLFEQAIDLHRDEPRPLVELGLAREHATQALELGRLEQAVDELWAERERLRGAASSQTYAPSRHRLVNTLWARLTPLYRWSLANGLGWLRPLKERTLAWMQRNGI